MQAISGKENNLDEETKTSIPKHSIKPKAKAREFGRELTNTSQANKDKRAQNAHALRAAKMPKPSAKVSKLSSHFEALTLCTPTESLGGKNLRELTGAELQTALAEELSLRRKKVREGIPDYDMFKVKDAQEAAEYVDIIYEDMKNVQPNFRIERDYVNHPGELVISTRDRAQMIDFIEELHAIFDLIPETLFISIQTVDRFLGLTKDQTTNIKDLQRVAVAAVLIVSKYEDIIPPSLDEMIKQMKKPCTREQILALETQILNELGFTLTIPTSFRFLERFSRISPKYNSAMDYAEFVIELANYDFWIVMELKPSQIAAAALYIGGIATSGMKKWTKPLEKVTSVSLEEIKWLCTEYFEDLPKKIKDDMKGKNVFWKYQGYADSFPA